MTFSVNSSPESKQQLSAVHNINDRFKVTYKMKPNNESEIVEAEHQERQALSYRANVLP
jgi:hypothetical protein